MHERIEGDEGRGAKDQSGGAAGSSASGEEKSDREKDGATRLGVDGLPPPRVRLHN